MSSDDHKSSNSWFRAATICTAFAVVAAAGSVAEAQAPSEIMHAAVFAKNEHRKLLERKIDLNCALAVLGGSSPDTIGKYRSDAQAMLDAESTGTTEDMRRASSDNRRLEQSIKQMNKALTVSRA